MDLRRHMGMISENFWRGKRVFLTGHNGFKGAWLSLLLQNMGAIVTGYSLAPEAGRNLFELAKVADGMHSIIGDIRDCNKLADAVRESKPEIVFHLAAQALVRRAYSDPVQTYSTNVMGLVNLFEAIRNYGSARALVNVTSDKCYENKEWVWAYREDEPMGGHDPYSSSKACAEIITSAYHRSYFNGDKQGVAIASARAGNVIGGGDWAQDRLVPDIIRAFEAGKTVDIRNPSSIRPWQHVLEPLSGYLLLAQKLFESGKQFSGAWNFGPSNEGEKSVQWIVEKLVSEWGDGASWRIIGNTGPHEAQILKLDCSKARTKLHWSPSWDIGTTISKLTTWYKHVAAGGDCRSLTRQQINDYVAALAARV